MSSKSKTFPADTIVKFDVVRTPYNNEGSFDSYQEAEEYIKESLTDALSRPVDDEYRNYWLSAEYVIQRRVVTLFPCSTNYNVDTFFTEEDVAAAKTITPNHESLDGVTHWRVMATGEGRTELKHYPIINCKSHKTAIRRARREFDHLSQFVVVGVVVSTEKYTEGMIVRSTFPINLHPKYI